MSYYENSRTLQLTVVRTSISLSYVGDDDISDKPKVLYMVEQIEGLTLCSTPKRSKTLMWDGSARVFTSSRKKNLDEGGPEIMRKRVISKIDRGEKRKIEKICVLLFSKKINNFQNFY